MEKFSQTKFFKVVLVLTLFGFLIFFNPYNFFNPARRAVLYFTVPFQKVFYFISLKSLTTKDFIFSIGQLKTDYEDLAQQTQGLLVENARLRDIEKENEFLREQLNLLPREKFEMTPANVVSQDPHGLGSWLEIDKGHSDGLKEGMAVVISRGILVGKLQEVYDHSSKVILLTNPKSAVNGIISETGTKGIAKGEYGLGFLYDMILQSDVINIGDEVITSGIGGDIPRGFYIGKVQEIHPSDDHLFQQAVLASPVETSNLQFVFVVKSSK